MRRGVGLLAAAVLATSSVAAQGTVSGRVAARGVVFRTGLGPDPGNVAGYRTLDDVVERRVPEDASPTWVRYDEVNQIAEYVSQDMTLRAIGRATYNAYVSSWTTARDDVPDAVVVARADFGSLECLGFDGLRSPTAELRPDTRSVLVRPAAPPPPCASLVLAESPLDDPASFLDAAVGSVLVDREGRVAATAPQLHLFGYETAFFTPAEDAPLGCDSFDGCPLSGHRAADGSLTVWAPIAGVEMETVSLGQFFTSVTDVTGSYLLGYRLQSSQPGASDLAALGVFLDTTYELSAITGRLRFDAFNPRSPSSRFFFLRSHPVGAGVARVINFPVDAAVLNALIWTYTVDAAGRVVPLPAVDLEIELDDHTEFLAAPVDETVAGIGFATQISSRDLRDTDVYLFRQADGRLLGARWGFGANEVAASIPDPSQFPGVASLPECLGFACLSFAMLTRGPASTTSERGGAHFHPVVDGVSRAASEARYLTPTTPQVDFVNPGDRVRIVAVNRATGYVGTASTTVTIGPGGTTVIGDAMTLIEMGPPNLRVSARRRYESGREDSRTTQIGFEGSALTGDTIEITTEWFDHDGRPLPELLPGYTGRVARSVGGDVLLGVGDVGGRRDALGQFPIRPGKHTVFLRLPAAEERYHYYLHIDGAPTERLVDFSGAGPTGPDFSVHEVCYDAGDGAETCVPKPDSGDSLDTRPADFVPFLVQRFDAAATRALALERARLAREAVVDGETLPVVEDVERIYRWLYSPELQFSVHELDVHRVDIVTDEDGTDVSVDYSLQDPGVDDLERFTTDDREFVFGVGYGAFEATVGADESASSEDEEDWPTLEELREMSASRQAEVLGDMINELTLEDFLSLSLHQVDDPANPLWELDGLPLVLADSRELQLERRHENAEFGPGVPSGPPYTDTYELVPFVLFERTEVEVRVLDGDDEPVGDPLIEQRVLPPGLWHFNVTAEDILSRGINPSVDPRYTVELVGIEPDPDAVGDTDEESAFRVHRVRFPGEISERHDNLKLGQTVVHDVLIQDGSLRISRQDFSLPGVGPALELARSYTNISTEQAATEQRSPLGPGWRHNYEMLLRATTTEETTTEHVPTWVAELDGRFFRESEVGVRPDTWTTVHVNGTAFRRFGGAWHVERGRHGMLDEVDGELVYTSEDGTRYYYPVPELPPIRVESSRRTHLSTTDSLFFRLLGPGDDPLRIREDEAAPPRVGGQPFTRVSRIEDRNGNALEFAYDANGDYLQRVSSLATGRELTFDYIDVAGERRLRSVNGPLGLTVTYDYDGTTARLTSATRDVRAETYEYEPEVENGREQNLTALVTSPDGSEFFRQEFTYNTLADLGGSLDPFVVHVRPQDVIDTVEYPQRADEGSGAAIAQFSYAQVEGRNARVVLDPEGNSTTYFLNIFGNPVEIREPEGKRTEMDWSIDQASSEDNILLAKREFDDNTSTSRQWTYDYARNTRGRVTEITETDPYGNTTVSTYDPDFGLPLTRTDRNGVAQSWTYDTSGNIQTFVDGDMKTWTFGHDDRGLRTSMLAPGHTIPTTWTYDEFGLVESETRPQVGDDPTVIQSDHDARGRLISRIDARGNETTFHYNVLDQLERIQYPPVAPFTYPAGRPAVQSQHHHRTEVNYTYDALGNRLTETDRNGLTLTYTYTAQNQVATVSRSEGGGLKRFHYDNNGNLDSETDWKEVATTHTYDGLNRRRFTTNRLGDSMERRYDAYGNLTRLIDYAGAETVYEYDDLDRPTRKQRLGTGGFHQEMTYYDEADPETNLRTLVEHRDPLATVTTEYFYDGRYNRIRRRNALGDDFRWYFEDDGDLFQTQDEEGNFVDMEYDDQRRLSNVYRYDGMRRVRIAHHDYDVAGNRVGTTDARDNETLTRFDAWNRPYEMEDAEGYVTATLFDGEGNVVNINDANGNDRSVIRDRLGRVLENIDGVGDSSYVRAYDLNDNPTLLEDARGTQTQMVYDAEDREETITEAFGSTTFEPRITRFAVRDEMGNPVEVRTGDGTQQPTVFGYDAAYRVTSVQDPVNPLPLRRTYSANGLMLEVTNRRDQTTAYTYDELNRLDVVQNALGHEVDHDYDDVGNVTRITDRRDVVTTFTYDTMYRREEVVRAEVRQVTYDHDDAGNVTLTQDAEGNSTTVTYDGRNLPDVTTYADTTTSTTQFDGNGNLRFATNEAGQTTEFRYDGENRRVYAEFAGQVTTFDYDGNGNLRFATPPESQTGGRNEDLVRVLHYNPFNELQRAVEPNGLETEYEYDRFGNLRHTYDPERRHVEYRYDDLNRRTHVVQHGFESAPLPTPIATETRYDPEGNIETLIDALGQEIEFTYDAIDRPATASYPVRGTVTLAQLTGVTWDYDHNDNVTLVTETKAGENGGSFTESTSASYDDFDRLDDFVVSRDGATPFAVDLGYDDNGSRTLVASPNGTTTYRYDDRNRLDRATLVGPPDEHVDYTYTPDGRMERVDYPNGTFVQYGYQDSFEPTNPVTNRIMEVTHTRSSTGGPAELARYRYQYDRNGNRTREHATIQGVLHDTTLDYDSLDRLAGYVRNEAGTIVTTTYSYQAYNRGTETVSRAAGVTTRNYAGHYDGLNRLLQVDQSGHGGTATIQYGYDDNGNTSYRDDGSTRVDYEYDARNLLVRAFEGSAASPDEVHGRWDYDAEGRRVRHRESSRGPINYFYDGTSVLEEHDDTGSLVAHYRYADRLISLDAPGERQFYHHDAMGSVGLLTGPGDASAGGMPVATYRVNPFGAIREESGASVNRSVFTGHRHDDNTGLVYMNARYYDPATGRFLTQDTYLGEGGNPPSLHRYLYAFSNPGRFWDPSGNNAEEMGRLDALAERVRGWRQDLTEWIVGGDPQTVFDGARERLDVNEAVSTQMWTLLAGFATQPMREVEDALGLGQDAVDLFAASAPRDVLVALSTYVPLDANSVKRGKALQNELEPLVQAADVLRENPGVAEALAQQSPGILVEGFIQNVEATTSAAAGGDMEATARVGGGLFEVASVLTGLGGPAKAAAKAGRVVAAQGARAGMRIVRRLTSAAKSGGRKLRRAGGAIADNLPVPGLGAGSGGFVRVKDLRRAGGGSQGGATDVRVLPPPRVVGGAPDLGAVGRAADLGRRLRSGAETLPESVLYRIRATGPKGRRFGSPASPDPPTLGLFNPRIYEMEAGRLRLGTTMHAPTAEQMSSLRSLSNAELVQFRAADPISSHGLGPGSALNVTGGHNRLAEIARRVQAGEMPADAIVWILLHD